MQIYSWNVNGLRALHNKGIFLDWLNATQPDLLAIQETKAAPEQLPDEVRQPEGYFTYWVSAQRKGYSGVAIYSKQPALSIQVGLGIAEYDDEGRTLIAEYDDFYLISAYFPSGSSNPEVRVPFKLAYSAALISVCDTLRAKGKGVIFAGDVNIAHQAIDLARPKGNEKNSGFLPEERAWLDTVVSAGYVDSFRALYPEQAEAYTWWSMRSGARQKNIGWRLDYIFVSPELAGRVGAAAIHADVLGSDHCPVSLALA